MSQPSAHRYHAIDYVELTVTNLDQAKRFYADAFGWQFNDYGPSYAGIRSPRGTPHQKWAVLAPTTTCKRAAPSSFSIRPT